MCANCAFCQSNIYPDDIEKNVLVEDFTSQTCTNCINGHNILNGAIAAAGVSVIEVSHHSGYIADIFTMQEDEDITFLYGGATYAPAVAFDRYDALGKEQVVMDSQSLSSDIKALQNAAKEEPYVTMAMDAKYDETTREVALTAKVYCYRQPELNAKATLHYTLYLLQDSVIAAQSQGGTDFKHNNICRGCLTDGSFGEVLNIEDGKVTTLEKTFILPDTITSTATTKTGKEIAVVKDNMRIVMLVHSYAKPTAYNKVFNCAQVKIGESMKQKGFKDESDGIEEILSSDNITSISSSPKYNILGQRISNNAKGLVIERGRKIIYK